MNTQVTSIALFETVIPASEPISERRDSLGWLAWLRACVSDIAWQLSVPLIIRVEWVLCQSLANEIEVLKLLTDVAVNQVRDHGGKGPGSAQRPRTRVPLVARTAGSVAGRALVD